MTWLLGVAHGSRDTASQAAVASLLDQVAGLRPGLRTAAAFIDNASPSVRRALRVLAEVGATDVVVLPLLLTAAGHSKTDVAASVRAGRLAHPGMNLRYGRPLGPDPVLVELLDRRLEAAGARPGDGVLVVAGGSLDPDANGGVAQTARLLQERRGAPDVGVAFASTAAPDLTGGLRRLAVLGHARVAVARYFLGPGYLPGAVAEAARRASVPVVADVLGDDPAVAALLAARYDEARSGPVALSCDTCLHRVPLPGREGAVGAPQREHRHPDD